MVQAIPAYPMNLFKFPVTICKELDYLIANFWWRLDAGRKHIHWVSQATLGLPKENGGIGFRHFMHFNDALLAKQCWRLIHKPDSLWAQVLKARYFLHCSFFFFLYAKRVGRASWAWSSLLMGRDILLQGTHWQVMSEMEIRVWHDRWLPSISVGHPLPTGPVTLSRNTKVASLINQQSGDWDIHFL